MPTLSKSIEALQLQELKDICSDLNIDVENRTAGDIRKMLLLFLKQKPEYVIKIPGFDGSKSPSLPETSDFQYRVTEPPGFTTTPGPDQGTILVNQLVASLSKLSQTGKTNYIQFLQECHRRKLHFSGGDENVNKFLSEFDKVADLFTLSEVDKVKMFPELLQGAAALFFKSKFENVSVWDTISTGFRVNYHQFYPESKREINLLMRTQAEGEKIDTFLSSVKLMNDRLRKPRSDSDLLSIVMGNLHPKYYEVLTPREPQTFQDLETRCKELERRRAMESCYKPPPRDLLTDEEFGPVFESKSSWTKVTPCKKVNVMPAEVQVEVDVTKIDQKKGYCWNCHLPGHTYHACLAPRTVFCYKCGKPNSYAPLCECNQPPQQEN